MLFFSFFDFSNLDGVDGKVKNEERKRRKGVCVGVVWATLVAMVVAMVGARMLQAMWVHVVLNVWRKVVVLVLFL
jgi:amino acid transporter